jgi:predicted metal-binding protein
MITLNKYVKMALQYGAEEAKIIDTKNIVIGNWVRLKCQYGCSGYGKRLTCPPFSPKPEYTKKMISEYKKALILSYHSKPGQERAQRRKMHKAVTNLEREIFLDGYYKTFAMVAGPCRFCVPCDVENACRFPEFARPAMEACGIDVYQTARNSGIKLEVAKSTKDISKYCCLILIE